MSLTFLFWRFFGFMVPPLPAATVAVAEKLRTALIMGEEVVVGLVKRERRGSRWRKREERVVAMVAVVVVGKVGLSWC